MSSSSSSRVPGFLPDRQVFDVELYVRDSTGELSPQHPSESHMATCATMAVNTCRAMLKTKRLYDPFTELAMRYRELRPQACFLPGAITAGFLEGIEVDFPRIHVDDRITNPSIHGYHKGHVWDGHFWPSDQCICLNGNIFRNMCNALAMSRKSQARFSADARDHQNLCFLFANTLVHEIAHVFITYLSNGREATPPGLMRWLPGIVPLCGEMSGRILEEIVFGGMSSFWRNRINMDREGSKLMYSWTNEKGQRQSELETIENTLKEKIGFPYPTKDIKYKWELLPGAAEEWPALEFTDPVDHSGWPNVRDPGNMTP